MKKVIQFVIIVIVGINSTILAQIPTNGLIVYYPFSGNANDQSGNGYNGTVNGAVLTTDRFGNTNSAYNFDGVSNYISVADVPALRLNNTDFTISVWLNETSRASTQEAVISKRGTGSANGYLFNIEGGTQPVPGLSNFQVSGGADPRAYSSSVIPLNVWKHIVLTYELSTNTIKTYIDGILDNTTTGIPSPNSGTSVAMNIGAESTGLSYFFHGKIDDIGMYNRVLSNTEIQELYMNCSDDISSGMLLKLDFDGNANDQSGNGYNGTVNGATLTTDRFGNANSAYNFDGVSNYISVSDAPALRLNNTDFTISAWINETSRASTQEAVISKRGSGSSNGYLFNIEGASQPIPGLANFQVSGGADPRAYSSSVVPLNVWTHIVWTYELSTNTMKTYIDGVLDNTTTGIPSPNSATSVGMKIGAESTGLSYFFHGKIDDIRIYGKLLAGCGVSDLFNETSVSTNDLKFSSSNRINVYPNPAKDYFSIDFSGIASINQYTIDVSNVLGEHVFTSEVNSQTMTLNCSAWGSEGLYFIRLIDSQGNIISVKKIIFQR